MPTRRTRLGWARDPSHPAGLPAHPAAGPCPGPNGRRWRQARRWQVGSHRLQGLGLGRALGEREQDAGESCGERVPGADLSLKHRQGAAQYRPRLFRVWTVSGSSGLSRASEIARALVVSARELSLRQFHAAAVPAPVSLAKHASAQRKRWGWVLEAGRTRTCHPRGDPRPRRFHRAIRPGAEPTRARSPGWASGSSCSH